MSANQNTPNPTTEQPAENLWPQTIRLVKLRAPASILKEQASLTWQKTQNIIVAEVKPAKADDSDSLSYVFFIDDLL